MVFDGSTGSSSIKFGSQFPDTYFPGSPTMKKDYLGASNFSDAIAEGKIRINLLIASAGLTEPAAQWCADCFTVCADEFFYMPTSSTGKYHGGPKDSCNCVGGNIVHTEQVLATSARVLRRYEDALGVFYDSLSEALRVGCILHDVCKYSAGSLWVSKTHGESGSELIRSVKTDYTWAGLIASAVQEHMYYWKFSAVYDSLTAFGSGSLNGLFLSFMLSEADYYSF